MTICDAIRVFIDLNGELEIYDIRNISLSIHFNVRLKLIYSEINLIYLTARLMKHNFTPLFISQMICLDIFFHFAFFSREWKIEVYHSFGIDARQCRFIHHLLHNQKQNMLVLLYLA